MKNEEAIEISTAYEQKERFLITILDLYNQDLFNEFKIKSKGLVERFCLLRYVNISARRRGKWFTLLKLGEVF